MSSHQLLVVQGTNALGAIQLAVADPITFWFAVHHNLNLHLLHVFLHAESNVLTTGAIAYSTLFVE